MTSTPQPRLRSSWARRAVNVALVLLSSAVLSLEAYADVIYSNYGTTPWSSGSGILILGTGNLLNSAPTKDAAGFFSGPAFTLESVQVNLWPYDSPGSTPVSLVNASLFLGNATVPLSLIETVSLHGLLQTPTDYTVDFTDFLVPANSYVWIGLTNDTGNLVWYQNGSGITGLVAKGLAGSSSWTSAPLQTQWLLEVRGTPVAVSAVPEPASYAVSGAAILFLTLLRRAARRGRKN